MRHARDNDSSRILRVESKLKPELSDILAKVTFFRSGGYPPNFLDMIRPSGGTPYRKINNRKVSRYNLIFYINFLALQ
jgi:hypothetical protein